MWGAEANDDVPLGAARMQPHVAVIQSYYMLEQIGTAIESVVPLERSIVSPELSLSEITVSMRETWRYKARWGLV